MSQFARSATSSKPLASSRCSRAAVSRTVVCSATTTTTATTVEVKERTTLGKSGVEVSSVGIGAWSWGDRSGYWGYGKEYDQSANAFAYQAIMDAGIDFIDTAEVYGFGKSEEFLGKFMRESKTNPTISTKFAPLPWRFVEGSVPVACQASLERLGVDQVGLYMIHWPGFLTQRWSNDEFVKGLALCVERGYSRSVGVSNFSEKRLRRAHAILQDLGVPLAINQVQYSLLYREPERNGVLAACKELGITLMAYSPLAQGLLTGKYTEENLPTGVRGGFVKIERIREIQPLLSLMRDIGSAHGNKSPAQVAINWLLCKGVLPIPGAKNAAQVREIAGALGWRLTDDEVKALDAASLNLEQFVTNPVEKF